MDETNWYDDHRNLHAVALQMGEKGDDIGPIMHMLEKPWHYNDEWAEVVSRREGEAAAVADLAETETM